ncbi:D-isomer specific 2-hydroxyacid dehydrogenase [Xylariales sp. PMI_506]|nr:D-isomer specific 2-hydroxyacid dehydrogenase [Xylariales sp. PMI_506]
MSISPASSTLKNDVLLIQFNQPPQKAWIAKIKSQHPELDVRWMEISMTKNMRQTQEDVASSELWKGVTLLSSFVLPPPDRVLGSVRFIQLPSAGIDPWLNQPIYKRKDVVLCTGNGIHAPQIAEWVIAAWLSHQHHFPRYEDYMKTGYWEPGATSTVQDSVKARIGILGYGAIGRQVARLANALAMEVFAYTRSERSTPEKRKDDSYCVPGTGDPDGVIPSQWFHGASRESINNFLAQDLDVVLLCLPLSDETRGLLSHEQFDILSKKKTFVINVARGGHINQEALIQALESGKIRGAALDVADPEPLPADHPLWKAPNLLLTPHVSWQTQSLLTRFLDVLEANLDKLSKGEEPINLVNRELNY